MWVTLLKKIVILKKIKEFGNIESNKSQARQWIHRYASKSVVPIFSIKKEQTSYIDKSKTQILLIYFIHQILLSLTEIESDRTALSKLIINNSNHIVASLAKILLKGMNIIYCSFGQGLLNTQGTISGKKNTKNKISIPVVNIYTIYRLETTCPTSYQVLYTMHGSFTKTRIWVNFFNYIIICKSREEN